MNPVMHVAAVKEGPEVDRHDVAGSARRGEFVGPSVPFALLADALDGFKGFAFLRLPSVVSGRAEHAAASMGFRVRPLWRWSRAERHRFLPVA